VHILRRRKRDRVLATRRSAIAAALAAISAPDRAEAARTRSGAHSAEGSNEASEERQVLVKGVPVHYESRGSGQPLVMIHGFTLDRRSLLGCMEPVFAGRSGWRRIYLDLPGMGRTPGSGAIASSDDMLDVVLRFIDAVIPGERFSVVGQSYGGYLARGVLARKAASIDGMALICPVVVAERARRDLPRHSVIARDEALLASLSSADINAFTPAFVVQNRLTWQRFREELLPAIRRADQSFLEAIAHRYVLSFDPDALSEPFQRPVLVLTGRQDSEVGYRDQWKMSENFPRLTFAMLDRAGHGLAIEQSGLLTRLAQEWLDRVAEASGPGRPGE
jgi:pimeloyl-ACP methyl ester carboxylesterase